MTEVYLPQPHHPEDFVDTVVPRQRSFMRTSSPSPVSPADAGARAGGTGPGAASLDTLRLTVATQDARIEFLEGQILQLHNRLGQDGASGEPPAVADVRQMISLAVDERFKSLLDSRQRQDERLQQFELSLVRLREEVSANLRGLSTRYDRVRQEVTLLVSAGILAALIVVAFLLLRR